jgi:hypothetical protein
MFLGFIRKLRLKIISFGIKIFRIFFIEFEKKWNPTAAIKSGKSEPNS